MPPRRGRWLVRLHRDLGYFLVGFILLFATSGILLNHRRDWDPDHGRAQEIRKIGDVHTLLPDLSPAQRRALSDRSRPTEPETERRLAKAIARQMNLPSPERAFYRGSRQFSVFFGEGEASFVDYDPIGGIASHNLSYDRFLVSRLNQLHRNDGGGLWTLCADIVALGLGTMAITGLLVSRGRYGLKGRGGLLLLVGLGAAIAAAIWLV